MSDDWVQCPICGSDVGAGAVADYDRTAYETGVQDSMLRATQYERILRDLIAELRLTPRLVSHWRHDPALESPVLDAVLDRAEQRLREVQGE